MEPPPDGFANANNLHTVSNSQHASVGTAQTPKGKGPPSSDASISKSKSKPARKVQPSQAMAAPPLKSAMKNSTSNKTVTQQVEVSSATPPKPLGKLPQPDEFEFSDPVKAQCLLCARQLKDLDTLRMHNAQSELHQVGSHLCSIFLI